MWTIYTFYLKTTFRTYDRFYLFLLNFFPDWLCWWGRRFVDNETMFGPKILEWQETKSHTMLNCHSIIRLYNKQLQRRKWLSSGTNKYNYTYRQKHSTRPVFFLACKKIKYNEKMVLVCVYVKFWVHCVLLSLCSDSKSWKYKNCYQK